MINNYLAALALSGTTDTWNADTNTTVGAKPVKLSDYYTPFNALYAVSTAGDTLLGGIDEWEVGDYAYCDGLIWYKIQNLATGGGGGSGTVTTVSVTTANGFGGTVATASTTPAITLATSLTGILKGTGTAMAVAVAGDFPTLNQNTTGSAAAITGGAANQLLIQTAANTTGFVPAPTVTNSVPMYNGTNIVWGTGAPVTFTPVLAGWTETGGAATVTGEYTILNSKTIFFTITIAPATSVASVAGTATITGLPVAAVATFSQVVGIFNETTADSLGNGAVVKNTTTIAVPTITTATGTIVISGTYITV